MKARIWNKSQWIIETNPEELKTKFNKLLIDSGFGVVGYIEKYFNPYGFTGIWLLSESHFALHTFPEEGKTYIELSSCIKNKFDIFIRNLEWHVTTIT